MKRNAEYIAILDVTTTKGVHYEKILYLYDAHTYKEASSKVVDICMNHNNDFSPVWDIKAIYALCGGVA